MQIWEFIWKLSYFEKIQILLNQRFFFYSAIRLICRESNYIHEQKEVLTHTKAQISIFFFFSNDNTRCIFPVYKGKFFCDSSSHYIADDAFILLGKPLQPAFSTTRSITQQYYSTCSATTTYSTATIKKQNWSSNFTNRQKNVHHSLF